MLREAVRWVRREAALARLVLSMPPPYEVEWAVAALHRLACAALPLPPPPGNCPHNTTADSNTVRAVVEEVARAKAGGVPPKLALAAHEWQRQFAHLLAARSPLVRVQRSSIDGAGDGVYAARALAAGRMACIYPGCIYLPSGYRDSSSSAGGFSDLAQFAQPLVPPPSPPAGSVYVLARTDGARIDASEVAGGAALDALLRASPHAVAHKVQHPPASREPNVTEVSVEVDVHVPVHPPAQGSTPLTATLDQAPYWWAPNPPLTPLSLLPAHVPSDALLAARASSTPTSASAVAVHAPVHVSGAPPVAYRTLRVPGVAFVAVRDIGEGEELFLDYGLVDERSRMPPWYTPVPPAFHHQLAQQVSHRLDALLAQAQRTLESRNGHHDSGWRIAAS